MKRLREGMETSLKLFDIALNNLKFQRIFFIDKSIQGAVQKHYDVGLFERFENKNEILEDQKSYN